jgi:bifunctional non-homologous end joining protein LigD
MTKASVREALARYRTKRDFEKTAEPSGDEAAAAATRGSKNARRNEKSLAFVIQKHAASHLHFDLRLELDGVMKSWAVPKGPSLDPSVKRLAMEVEDHPMGYNSFEGTIPKGQYGGGTVMLWDRGTYSPDEANPGESAQAAVRRGLRAGKLVFTFHGKRLRGSFALVRTRRGEGRAQWLLIKHNDDTADAGRDIVAEVVTSVASGRTMEAIASSRGRTWQSNRARREEDTPPASSNMQSTITPMEPTAHRSVPGAGLWAVEPHVDGTRVLVHVADGSVQLLNGKRETRSKRSQSDTKPEVLPKPIQDALVRLARKHDGEVVLDGIVVDGDNEGLVVVDMLAERGTPLVDEPWMERRARLEDLLGDRGRLSTRAGKRAHSLLRVNEYVIADGPSAMGEARARGWTRAVAKRLDAPYESGRSAMWKEA